MAEPCETVRVGSVPVRGLGVGPETRCVHYATDADVIAIRFYCCGRYFPCHACHDACTDHEAAVWPASSFDRPAVLCGVCGTELSIDAYLDAADACPACDAAFNPNCAAHYDLYFAVAES